MTIVWILLAGLIIAALAAGTVYNRLAQRRHRCRGAWSQVAVQLRRRRDLVASTVETVRRHAATEGEVLRRVLDACEAAAAAAGVRATVQAEGVLTTELERMLALRQRCVGLAADRNLAGQLDELTSIENRIRFSEAQYNDAVTQYNDALKSPPARVVAALFGLKPQVSGDFRRHGAAEPVSDDGAASPGEGA